MVYFAQLPEPGMEDAQRRLAELSENYTHLVMEYAELSGPRMRAHWRRSIAWPSGRRNSSSQRRSWRFSG